MFEKGGSEHYLDFADNDIEIQYYKTLLNGSKRTEMEMWTEQDPIKRAFFILEDVQTNWTLAL